MPIEAEKQILTAFEYPLKADYKDLYWRFSLQKGKLQACQLQH